MNRSERPLRILCVINLPWDARLGAARVWMELTEQWRAAGHTVDHFSLSEAFPKPTGRNPIISLRQVRFVRRAARFIRKNGSHYDVIDALLGTVPFSKKNLRFHRLLVARSVGFYWLYEKFERHARVRWPEISRGKIAGRLFYTFTRQHALRSAALAVGHADLVNLPNEDELKSLRKDLRSDTPAIIQPYGLSDERHRELAQAARSAEARLAAPRISFLGMWSVRKGARDLGEVVRRIRAAVPHVGFRFLGTFTADETVLRDLRIARCDWCEIVREYDPTELPALLSDCAAGIFPSYVEGFGLGLLEQLAAGIPTVAYDAPGPRQILAPARGTLLVAAGDVAAMSARVAEILRLPLPKYAELREQSSRTAAQYSWSDIAADTINAYRAALQQNRGPLLFVQPFGWCSPGGGARIIRALLADAPVAAEIVCTSPRRPPLHSAAQEKHLPLRPAFGRVERSRFAGAAHSVTPLFARKFARRLEQLAGKACAIHAVAHGGLDFLHACELAEKLHIPFFLQVHDDFMYTARDCGAAGKASGAIARAWSRAAARFVISHELGQEYQHRYGAGDYVVITDGLGRIARAPRQRASGKLRVYFMGLFHLEYEPNLQALLRSLREIQCDGLSVSMTMRCGGLRRGLLEQADFVRVLPFAEETQIEHDLREADLLYLPLPIDAAHAPFVRFSLSTKLVTYLGSGIPILFHGPEESAVGELLRQNRAALFCHSLEPVQLTTTLRDFAENPATGHAEVSRALALARAEFSLPHIREKFWGTIRQAVDA
jgi:glycosyltransferase involved in cell wall biosynthesis